MKKFLQEFKAFALRGNVLDLAVGVLIGGAFSSLVTSLTQNILSPIIGLLGGANFDDYVLRINGATIQYGAFITAVINFLIMAFLVFLIVKGIHKLESLGTAKRPRPRPRPRPARSAAPKSISRRRAARIAPRSSRPIRLESRGNYIT